MNHHSRRILTPGASRKRKEMEAFHSATSPKPLVQSTAASRAVSLPNPTSSKGTEPPPQSNRLLAGYMAFEFLTKGTLFGQKFDPARAEAVPVSLAEPKRHRQSQLSAEDAEPKPQCYAELVGLLRVDEGAHIPGVVNPTQLARWIQM